jgi:hypothetical protein
MSTLEVKHFILLSISRMTIMLLDFQNADLIYRKKILHVNFRSLNIYIIYF